MTTWQLLIDGLIIVLYFVSITAVGLCMGRRQRSLEDYALGGRHMPWWAVMASIIAAETSAATFMGAPAEGFVTRGITYVQLTMGVILGRILVGHIFLKPYYTYRVYTVYDFLAVRFGNRSKNYVSALFLIMRLLASGVRLYVPSLVMVLAWRLLVGGESVRYGQLDSWVPYAWAILLLTTITCAYTMLGGIRAVIWTDLIQATLMFSSALVAVLTILCHIGQGSLLAGLRALIQQVPEMARPEGYFLTGLERARPGSGGWELLRLILEHKYTLPAALIATTAANLAAFGTDQDMVQRMLTAPDYRKSRRSLLAAALMDVPIAAVFTFIGVLLIAFYDQHPELRPAKANDVFGAYILSAMPVVVRGFVLAGVFATAMGSLSAALNALATSLTNDWYLPYLAGNRGPTRQVAAARVFTGLFAVLMMLVAVAFAWVNVRNPGLTIIPVALGIAGYILGPMLGVFLVGMLTTTRGSDRGNVLAVTAGLIAIFTLSGRLFDLIDYFRPDRPSSFPTWLPKIEFTWYALVGAVVTMAVGLVFRTPPAVIQSACQKSGAGSPTDVDP